MKRVFAWLPWVALGLYAVCGLELWVRAEWRPEWDSAIYLLLGRSLAAGGGYLYLGEPFFLRPPGLSWLLSWLSPAGEHDYATVHRLVFLAAVAVLMAGWRLLLPRYGNAVACAVMALVGTSPLFLRQLNWVVAELPFLALLLASFVLLHRAARDGARFGAWSLAGAFTLAAAVHLRTVGLVALPALLLLGRGRRGIPGRLRGLLPAAVVLFLSLPWMLYTRDAAATARVPSEQLLLFSYSTALWHQDPGDPASLAMTPADLLARAVDNGTRLLQALAAAATLSSGPLALLLVAGLVLPGLVGVWRAGPTLLDGFAVCYLLLLLSYFTFDSRLLLPLLPSFYLYLLQGASRVWLALSGVLGRRESRHAALAASLAALAVANAVQAWGALHPEEDRLGSVRQGERWEEQRAIARWLAEVTPVGAVVLADEAPVLSLLSGRTVYTYRYRRSAGLLDRYPVDFVLLPRWSPPDLVAEVEARCERLTDLPLVSNGRSVALWRVPQQTGRPRLPPAP